jgi:ferredoxin
MARNFLGAEQINDRLFSLFVFLHLGLPLALLAGMWVHVQRLGQPATVMPRRLALAAIALLLALALVLPVKSELPWDPGAVPQAVAIDWFMLFLHPLMYATSPAALWALVLGTTLLLAGLPWLARRKPLPAAVVNLDNCNGCGRCIDDCPYEAVTRRPDKRAVVLADRCASCGICAGACPSATPFRRVTELVSGIDLPDFTVHDLRRQLQAKLDARAEKVVFRCEHAAQPAAGGEISLRCLAQLPPSFVEYALRRGARRVEAVGCREGACKWRLGMDLCAERFAGTREPHLRRNVRAEELADGYAFALR